MHNFTRNFDNFDFLMMLICSPFWQHQHYGFEPRGPENFSRSSGSEHLLIGTRQEFALPTAHHLPGALPSAVCNPGVSNKLEVRKTARSNGRDKANRPLPGLARRWR